jgi:hypothetical protein
MEPKFPDVFPWGHRRPPNLRPIENAASSGQIVRFNVDESFSFFFFFLVQFTFFSFFLWVILAMLKLTILTMTHSSHAETDDFEKKLKTFRQIFWQLFDNFLPTFWQVLTPF